MKLKPFLLTPALVLVPAAPAAAAPPTVTAETKYTSNQYVIRDTIEFIAKATDPDGTPLTYAWTITDGTTADTATFTRTYDTVGDRTATVTVTDADGETATASVTVKLISFDDYRMPVVVDNVTTTQNIAPHPYPTIPTRPSAPVIPRLSAVFGKVAGKLAKDGGLRVPFTYASGEGDANVEAVVRTAKPVKASPKAKAKVLKLGYQKTRFPVGTGSALVLKLKPADLKLVKRLKRVPVVVEARLTDAAGQTTSVTRKVTLTAAK